MSPRVKRLIRFAIYAPFLLLALGIAGPILFSGCWLSADMFYEASVSKQIRVVEHSCIWDNRPSASSVPYSEKIYKTVTLDPTQISKLRGCLLPALDYSSFNRVNCFYPHHRIEFVHANGSVTTVEICFHCGNLSFDNNDDRIMPVGWADKLSAFVSSLGMKPKGPFE